MGVVDWEAEGWLRQAPDAAAEAEREGKIAVREAQREVKALRLERDRLTEIVAELDAHRKA